MGLNFIRLDYHVINVHFHVPTNLVFEDFIHQALVSSSCIFLTKWKDLVAIVHRFNYESNFLYTSRVYTDLVVPIICV